MHRGITESMHPKVQYYRSEDWHPNDILIKDQQKCYSLTLGAKDFNSKSVDSNKDSKKINAQ